MSEKEILYEYSLRNTWQDPHADRQVLLQVKPISTTVGAVGFLNLEFKSIRLPSGDRYVVYELGNVNLHMLGLDSNLNDWVTCSELMFVNSLIINIMFDGVQCNLAKCYLKYVNNGSLILAIDYNSNKFCTYGVVQIRFYSNFFYTTTPLTDTRLKYLSLVVDINDIAPYISLTQTLQGADVNAFKSVYVNGFYYPYGLPAFDLLKHGDTVTSVIDPHLIDTSFVLIDELNFYISGLDNKRKLIVYLDESKGDVYVDDIEFYIVGTHPINGLKVGVYFSRLNPNTVIPLTYKDWALDTNTLLSRIASMNKILKGVVLNDLSIYMVRRSTGNFKPTMLDSNRIADLANLPTQVRRSVITGVKSTFVPWRAESLESSPLFKFLSSEVTYLSSELFKNVYSRHAAKDVLESVFKSDVEGQWLLPPITSNWGGRLLTYNEEGFPYLQKIPALFQNNVPYIGKGYEVFLPIHNPLNDSDDIENLDYSIVRDCIKSKNLSYTDVPLKYGYVAFYLKDGVIEKCKLGLHYTEAIVNDCVRLNWSSDVTANEKVIKLSSSSIVLNRVLTDSDYLDGVSLMPFSSLPFGSLMVYLNGRYIIEGLDYGVIENRIYFTSIIFDKTTVKNLFVVYAGLTEETSHNSSVVDWGWVEYGKIANNKRYDLLTRRGYLFFVDGKPIEYNRLSKTENYKEDDTLFISDFVDGTPYAIVKKPTFITPTILDEYTCTELTDKVTDDRLREFLTELMPQEKDDAFISIPTKYDLVSPFFNVIVESIKNGNLNVPNDVVLDQLAVSSICLSYRYLLKIDPVRMNHNKSYVTIGPRFSSDVVEVSLHEWEFLSKINKYLLNDEIEGLNNYVHVH